MKRSKIIIVSSAWTSKLKSLPYAFQQFITNLRSDQKVIVISDYPTFDKNPLRSNRGIIHKKEKSQVYELRQNKLPDFIIDLKDRDKLIIVNFGESEVFNDAPFYNDTIMYYDKDHLNYYGSSKLGENDNSNISSIIKQIQNNNKKI